MLRKSEVHLVKGYDPSAQLSIVPPTWDKSEVAQWPWNDVWRASRRSLAQARLMLVIGYSVPITDQLSQALLRADVNNLSGLVIVNPDPAARRRVKALLSSALTDSSSVIELSSFREFAHHLPTAPTEEPLVDIGESLRRLEVRLASAATQLDNFEFNSDEHGIAIDEIRDTI